MLKVDNLVPEVYFKESRDFSYIGRVFEIIFNYMKTVADLTEVNFSSENINSNIVELAANTLGFESKHKYITKDLIYIISDFSNLLRKKGTLDAVQEVIRLLCTSQNLTNGFDVEYVPDTKHTELKITLPTKIKDIVLIEDLFDYILPTGVLYTIEKADIERKRYDTEIVVEITKPNEYKMAKDAAIGIVDTEIRNTTNIGMLGVVVADTATETKNKE